MAPIRRSKRSSGRLFLAVAATLAACGPRPPPPASVEIPAVSAREGEKTRHPDGVLIEPPAALPRATDRAPARGVVALREPLADDAIRDVVHAYIKGWVSEDSSLLEQLLTLDCTSLDAAHHGRGALLQTWRQRIQNLDYKKLAGSDVARFDRIERYDIGDLGASGAPARPPEMRAGDVLARVPIATPRVGAEVLFPEVLVLLLRREEGKYRIAGVGEESGP